MTQAGKEEYRLGRKKSLCCCIMTAVLAAGIGCGTFDFCNAAAADELEEKGTAAKDPESRSGSGDSVEVVSCVYPPGMPRFLELLRKQDNPYLGVELFEHALEMAKADQTAAGELTREEEPEMVSEMIFVGDSRVVGMSMAGGYIYVGRESIGYDWFVSEGIYQLQNEMAAYPDAEVILCFGVNDVGNIGAYINYYQWLIENYPETDFWMMSVNPVNDQTAASCGYFINSSMVHEFNALLSQAFPDRYLDCCGYLEQNGYGTSDGVHYDVGTYLVIQEYCRYLINEKQNGLEDEA